MRRILLPFAFLALPQMVLFAQMSNGKFGNEWIRYDHPYFKVPVAQDGIYRIHFEALTAQGVQLGSLSNAQVYCLGEQIPIYIGENYIEFFGRKNRGELDRFLYKNGESDMLNPEYSMFTDTAAYYLTFTNEAQLLLRYENKVNDLNNSPAKEEWFWQELSTNLGGSFIANTRGDVNQSIFELGEGFGFEPGLKTAYQTNLLPTQRYAGVASDSFQIRLAGIGSNPHFIQTSINNTILHDQTIQSVNNQMWDLRFSDEASASQSTINLTLLDTLGRIAVAYAKLLYPHTFHFENKNQFLFHLNGTGEAKYLEIEGFQHNNIAPILYDLTARQRIITQLEAGKVKVKLETFSGVHEFYLVNPENIISTNDVKKIEFDNFPETEENAEFIIISSRKLQSDALNDYAAYRSQEYQVAVVNIEDLYEQFAYGIQRHPLAVRNFGHYIKAQWPNAKFILIIGKGQEFNATGVRSYNNDVNSRFFVPTFGFPGSDNLLIASNDSQVPVLPIGRIAATKASDIQLYLEKLKDYENPADQSAENRAWRKEIIHLGGGKDTGEQLSIESAMNQMKRTISENGYGAHVSTFYKMSNDPTQRLESEEINQLLQEGVGVITFFGHGGYTVIDISIGEASSFTNYKKYPVMFALGCYSGNIHIPNISYSENFVFQPNKAGIAFVGTSYEGTIPSLGPFQRTVYEFLGDHNTKSLGEIIQASIKEYDTNLNAFTRMLLQQFTLHGDPAIKILPYDAPDYLINKESVQFNPAPVSVQNDSFDLKFNVLNIGKNITDSLALSVTRRLPNGTQKIFTKKIETPAYQSEPINFTFPVRDSSSNTAGFNEFYIQLNPDNIIQETPLPEAELNNELRDVSGARGVKLFIFDKNITPIQPLNYAIVNTAPLRLSASTANVFETSQRYRMAIDTTKYFNSPLYKDTLFTTTGGVLDWNPNIILLDSAVYYWRVAIDSLIEGAYNWSNQSFTYIKNSSIGWRQSHFQQLQENELNEIFLPDSTRFLNFGANTSDLKFNIFRYPIPAYNYTNLFNYSSVNNTTNQYVGGIGSGGFIICVFDGASSDPWQNIRAGGQLGRFGSVIGESWASPLPSFPFSTVTFDNRKKVINFLKDSIPDGNYVFLYTIQHSTDGTDYKPEQWEADSLQNNGINLFNLLENEGAVSLRSTATEGARPYALLYRKGSGKLIFEELAANVQDTIFGDFTIPGFKTEGNIKTHKIGPASKWNYLQHNLDIDQYDNYGVNLYGIREDDSMTQLLSNFNNPDTSLQWIDVNMYPYLVLELDTRDTVKRSPTQFGYWQVLYEGIPEAALNPLVTFEAPKDTLQQGEPLQLKITINNLSNYDMDSLLINYAILREGTQVRLDSARLKPLLKQDTLLALIYLPTQYLLGKHQLQIEVNPDQDQPELFHFNNVGIIDFYVESDKRNPLVDVTFDGLRIMNGDIISAKPQIVVSLYDENPYLSLGDSNSIEISILYPSQTSLDSAKHIPFNQLRFEPDKPDGNGKRASVYFEPEFIEDGKYKLIINGQDASGNRAGNIDYHVEFEVITKSMISNVMNYPNPFSTSTQFVYTLTGREAPVHYKIQIMTIAGRIVRELTELDLGPLLIGTHRTEFAWDGTDQFGDRLANGIYLYRIIFENQNGNAYEKYDNGTDRFFKKDIGKLVILR
ncbi:MAG: C25 family cysteine peptidase [Saprospiraceae bacterium]|nr:C25 family cysteine peptidase [Saprospiraceae bacterium]